MEPSFYEDDNVHTNVCIYRQNRNLLDTAKANVEKSGRITRMKFVDICMYMKRKSNLSASVSTS